MNFNVFFLFISKNPRLLFKAEKFLSYNSIKNE